MSAAAEPARHDQHGPDYRRFEYLPVGRLAIDPRIERAIRPGVIDTIATEFSWAKFEVLTVIEHHREHTVVFIVVEGQHRTLAAKRFGADFPVPCMVVPEPASTDEPRIAYDISAGRRPHSAVDRLKLLFHSNEPYAVALMATLAERGLQPGSSRSSRTISAVGTMQTLVRYERRSPDEGAALLGETIDVILTAWPSDDPEHTGSRFDTNMLKGVGLLVARNPHYERDRLARTMSARMASAWVDRQNLRDKPWVSVASSLSQLYNRGLRLEERRLQW